EDGREPLVVDLEGVLDLVSVLVQGDGGRADVAGARAGLLKLGVERLGEPFPGVAQRLHRGLELLEEGLRGRHLRGRQTEVAGEEPRVGQDLSWIARLVGPLRRGGEGKGQDGGQDEQGGAGLHRAPFTSGPRGPGFVFYPEEPASGGFPAPP